MEVGIFSGICQDETEGGFLTVTVDYFRATTDATELAQQIQAGPKIEGPWLWTIVPIGDRSGGEAVTSGIDFLAEASNGSVTETAIATEGASTGDIVGSKRWTPGKLAPTGWNNMNDLVNAIGLGIGDVDYHVAYGSITLDSPSEQETTMYVGSDDSVKVWLNGALVHSNPIEGGAIGYQESFPVTLKEGENILLVAVFESWGAWSGFFGFEKGTTYTVVPPEMSTTPIDMAQPVDVLIYTNHSLGIDLEDAEMAAETTRNLLESEGISVEITKDGAFVRDWMLQTTNDGSVNVIVLYGVLPGSVYAEGDGSIAENWIETVDGNTILNHAEYLGYYADVGTGNRNADTIGVHGLQNLMDNPNITSFIHGQSFDDPLRMIVTSDGTEFTPSLADFGSYRPISLNQLQGRWFAEKVFASDTGNAQATYADPVIVRDGHFGRLAIVHSSNQPAEIKSLPNGEVAAEIISNYLLDENVHIEVPPEKPATPTVDIAQNYSQIYVDAVNGVNAVSGRGSADKPYKTITLALAISAKANLPDPWYVRIRPGTYHADPSKPVQEREIFPLKLRNGMIIEGTTNANECIIDAQHLGETKVPILLGENVGGVHIRNLTVQNMNNRGDRESYGDNEAQIMFFGTTEVPNTLEGCIVRGVKTDRWGNTHGLWTETPLVLVANTFINNLASGVWSFNNVVANNNTFDGNKQGGLLIGGNFRGDWLRVDSIGNITKNIFRNNSGWDDQRAVLYLNGSLDGNISHNTFIGNNSKYLMYTGNITGDVTHNTFENNGTADGDNASIFIYNFNGNFTHNTFTGNYSSHFILRNMTGDISYNRLTEYFSHVEVHNPKTVKVSHNIFESNTQDTYGNTKSGIRIDNRSGSENSIIEFSNNIFYNNKSSRADYVSSVRVENRPVHFINNLFMVPDESTAVESAPAIWLNSPECRFHNNIFAGMQTAIYVEGTDSIPITHNIFYSIGKDIVSQAGSGFGNDLELWELLADNASNNLALVPLFVDPLNEQDFHLKPASPAIDAGTNMYAAEDDFDGVARPVGDTVDIGPYEFVGKKDDTSFELGAWDVDENGVVNILDLVIVSQNFGLSPPTNPRADVTGDGHVNILDLVLVAQHFGESAGAPPSARVHTQEYIEPGTVQAWILQAQVADNGSAVFREGIANLKRLLAVSTPQKTALLANYPNPFNPETWIPYQLANPADVSITIYAADGKLVRTLTLGHQAVGKYHDRSRAAYWDGKNAQGETVASSVYFYTLTAGEFSATRKMLILK